MKHNYCRRLNVILKIGILPIIFLSLFSCSEESEFEDTFKNTTIYNVIVEPNPIANEGLPTWELNLKPGETKTHSSSETYLLFDVTPNDTTTKNFNCKLKNGINTIYCYNYKVSYVISGTAKKANLTFNTPSGGTGQRSSVSLPCRINYDKFGDDFLYISAQNDTEYGSITVQIYYEDSLVKSASASGAYSIATASR
jgi:hypothetical protein